MIRLLMALTIMLCLGCASIGRKDMVGEPDFIPISEWQQLQIDLLDAPPDLFRAIKQAVEVRLQSKNKAVTATPAVSRPSREVLLDVLTHSQDQALIPDDEFVSLRNVVIGVQREQEQPYAAALASYLTQSDFSCQQPLYGRYFQRRYSAEPTEYQCPAEVPFSVLTRYDGATNVWLDPKRVKSIHLLFAGMSESLASRFGHLALRLVVCPEGKTSASECDANLFEHLVLGYQAHIDELSLNTLKALNGDYPLTNQAKRRKYAEKIHDCCRCSCINVSCVVQLYFTTGKEYCYREGRDCLCRGCYGAATGTCGSKR